MPWLDTHRHQCNRPDVAALLGGINRYEIAMNLLAYIIVGIVAGWLAEKITGRDHGLIMNLIVGIVGASIGGFLVSSLLGLHYAEGLNVPTIAVATSGAVLLLAIFGGFQKRQGRSL